MLHDVSVEFVLFMLTPKNKQNNCKMCTMETHKILPCYFFYYCPSFMHHPFVKFHLHVLAFAPWVLSRRCCCPFPHWVDVELISERIGWVKNCIAWKIAWIDVIILEHTSSSWRVACISAYIWEISAYRMLEIKQTRPKLPLLMTRIIFVDIGAYVLMLHLLILSCDFAEAFSFAVDRLR